MGVSYELGQMAPTSFSRVRAPALKRCSMPRGAQATRPPVVRDAALVDQLYRIPIDAPIGRELFPVMATLLAHLVQVDRHMQEKLSGVNP